MHLIFLDVETTDLGEGARVVQLAYKDSVTQETLNELFKPPVEISCGSMAVHHITNEMVCDKPSFEGSTCKEKLISLLWDNILVAHNAPFDMGVLGTEGVSAVRFIDTFRIAQHLVESENHKLQYLRYFLKLHVQGLAHDALGDVMVLESLFYYLQNLVRKNQQDLDENGVLAKMEELSITPVLQKIFPFGKYIGKTFADVAQMDRAYLKWLFESETKKPQRDQNQNLVHTLRTHLGVQGLF